MGSLSAAGIWQGSVMPQWWGRRPPPLGATFGDSCQGGQEIDLGWKNESDTSAKNMMSPASVPSGTTCDTPQ